MNARARPGKPPDAPQRDQPTAMEAWYLQVLQLWTERMQRPPVLHELAAWTKKSKTAVYSALISLEHKGWVTRVGTDRSKRADRRFVVVP